MSIPAETVEEVRARTDLEALVGATVALRPAGTAQMGLCPFHEEKTPSFSVSNERGHYKCFGCGEAGDCFAWLMKTEGLSFPEAARRLADAAGISVDEREADPEERARDRAGRDARAQRRRQLLWLHERAAEYYAATLRRDDLDEAREAAEYICGRGLAQTTVDAWTIGYAPRAGGLEAHIVSLAGGPEKRDRIRRACIAGGLLGETADGYVYERFKRRVMIPLRDPQGAVVGFAGRALDPGEKRKYVNSPATEIFDKSGLLYGLDRARAALRRGEPAIVVEGQLDVLAVAQAGRPAVASMGTAFTAEHAALLARYAQRAVVMMDDDEAGKKASAATAERLREAGMTVRTATL